MPRKTLDGRRKYAREYQKRRRALLATARWEARCARIESRKHVSDIDCAWAAGHFEGEGTVTLTRAGRIMYVRPQVSLSSTDVVNVEFFHERWPGYRRSFTPKRATGNVQVAHVWNLNSGERIQAFLLDILPQIRTARVRAKIEIVLADIKDRGLYQQQPEIRARSEHRRLAIRRLNAKGRAVLMPDGITVAQHVRPRIESAYKGDEMKALLPPSSK
jgi:hypothetical protein